MAKKEIVEVELSDELETLATQFADAMAEGVALQAQLGQLAREAAQMLESQPDNVAPFTDACKQLCLAHGLTEGTVDKTMSQLRGVIRALIGGADLPADASLRGMYDAIPKDPSKGGRKPGGKTSQTAKSGKGSEPVKPITATRADLVRMLFGHMDDKLMAAVEYAVKHEAFFTAWAESSAKAEQATTQPLRRAA